MPKASTDEQKECLSLWTGPLFHYYRALGVEDNATDGQIKSAWKKMSALLHPDKNDRELEEKARTATQTLNAAKDILLNKAQRDDYDEKLDFLETLDGDWEEEGGLKEGALRPLLIRALFDKKHSMVISPKNLCTLACIARCLRVFQCPDIHRADLWRPRGAAAAVPP